MMWDYYGHGWGGWFGATLMMLVMVAATTVVVVVVLRALADREGGRGESRQKERPAEAERLLDQRLARGEIDEDEYRSRRDLLRGHR